MMEPKFVSYDGDGIRSDWPYMFGLPGVSFIDGVASEQNKPVLEWCTDQFGPQADWLSMGEGRWLYVGLGEYAFRSPVDATAFRVRWS